MAEHNNKVNTEESTEESTSEKMGCNGGDAVCVQETTTEWSETKNAVDDVTKKMAETELMEP